MEEWHVPQGTEFIYLSIWNAGSMTGCSADVEYAIRKDLLEVRYTVENRKQRDRHRSATTSSGVPERHRAQDRVPDDLDRDARGSPCANDPIISGSGTGPHVP